MSEASQALSFQNSPQMSMANLGQAQGQAQLVQAQAKEAQIKLQQTIQMQQLLKQAASSAGVSPNAVPGYAGQQDASTAMQFIANVKLKVGDIAGYEEAMKNVVELNLKSAQADHLKVETIIGQNQAVIERAETNNKLISYATDQSTFDTANTLYALNNGGKPSPLAGMKWDDPETQKRIAEIKQTLIDQKSQADLAIKKARQESEDKKAKSYEAYMDAKAEAIKTLTPFQKAHLENLGKNGGKAGGKVPGSPNDKQVASAFQKISKAFPGLSDEEKAIKARALAARALAVKIAGHGIYDDEQAQIKALSTMPPDPGIGYQTGKTPIDALPLPSDRSFKAGLYYMTARGVLKFNGTDFEDVDAASFAEPEDVPPTDAGSY